MVKIHLYSMKEQEVMIAETIGWSRFVFNHFPSLIGTEHMKQQAKASPILNEQERVQR